jgi:hypothetical protein
MPASWDARKLDAWSQFLLTVTVRYVDGCACTTCDDVRARFVRRWTHYATLTPGVSPHTTPTTKDTCP